MRRFISRLFIILGIILLLATAGLVGYNLYDSKRAQQASADIMDRIDAMNDTTNQEDTDDSQRPIYELYPEMEMPYVEIDGYRYIATLEIPSISLKLPIMQEWDYTRLKISPCRYSGSAYTHDLVIAGHNYGSHFSQIKWIEPGTVVILTDMAGNTFHYTVSYTEILQPKDVDQMTQKQEDDQWDMTMFTCTTGGGERCAVRCIMDEEN